MDSSKKKYSQFLFLFLVLIVSIHPVESAYFMFQKREIKTLPPTTMELVIRRPSMKKPFTLRRMYTPLKNIYNKEFFYLKPLPPPRKPYFEFKTDHYFTIETEISNPSPSDITINSQDENESSKPVSVKDLDTGHFKAIVIQSPQNKKGIEGFVHIATAQGAQLRPPDKFLNAVEHLSQAINHYTNIDATCDGKIFLDSNDLLKVPILFISTAIEFDLTNSECRNFAEYIRRGGFVIIDIRTPENEFDQAETSLKHMLKKTLGNDIQFESIPHTHQLYRCFFDFENGPPLIIREKSFDTKIFDNNETGEDDNNTVKTSPDLKGIWVDNRLVTIYSDKGYTTKWNAHTNNESFLKMGVNMVVYALIQPGGIARNSADNLFETD